MGYRALFSLTRKIIHKNDKINEEYKSTKRKLQYIKNMKAEENTVEKKLAEEKSDIDTLYRELVTTVLSMRDAVRTYWYEVSDLYFFISDTLHDNEFLDEYYEVINPKTIEDISRCKRIIEYGSKIDNELPELIRDEIISYIDLIKPLETFELIETNFDYYLPENLAKYYSEGEIILKYIYLYQERLESFKLKYSSYLNALSDYRRFSQEPYLYDNENAVKATKIALLQLCIDEIEKLMEADN